MTEYNKHHVSRTEVYLEFKVGPLHFCAPVHEVEAILPPAKMQLVPISETAIACCLNHQGQSIPVIDMHSKFGLPFMVNKNRTHIIIATVENELKGFWVDRAINVVPLSNFEKDNSGTRPLSQAFFGFLLRDRETVLQTSFNRLFKCQDSDLSWIAGEKAEQDVPPDEQVEPVINEGSDSSTSAEVTQAEKVTSVPQIELPFTSKKNKQKSNKTGAINKKSAGEVRRNEPAPIISLAAISARVNSRNTQETDIVVPAESATITPTTRSCSNRVISISAHKNKIANRMEHDLNNKTENKTHILLILIMAMLVIIALGWSISYLLSLNMSSRIENTHSSLSGLGPTFISLLFCRLRGIANCYRRWFMMLF